MEIEVNGVTYSRFTSANIELRLDALSNTFTFTAVSTQGAPLPFTVGAECRITVDGHTAITGHIEVVEGDYDGASHSITVQGRDKTGDVVDSSLSKFPNLKPPISLKSIIQKVLVNIGNTSIIVADQVAPPLFNKAEDLAASGEGVGAFEFIEGLARKRQVLLTSSANGNIVIVKTPGPIIDSFILQNVIGSKGNNVLKAAYSYDLTGRYNVYKMTSSLNPTAISIGSSASNKDIVNQSGEVTDSAIREGRQLAIVPEGPYSNKQNTDRAQWEQRVRAARGQVYSATIQGHPHVHPNDMIRVFDDFAGISAEMLINSVSYAMDLDSGKTTTLSLVEKNAYNIQLQEPTTQKLGTGLAI